MWKRLYFRPLFASLSMCGVGTGPPNVEHMPKPTSSSRMSSTFGLPFGGLHRQREAGVESL